MERLSATNFPAASDTRRRLSLLCLAGLLVHSQFDLVLFRWPTNLLAMVFLGLLIHEREGTPAPFWRPPAFLRRFRWEFLKRLERSRSPEHRRTGRLIRPVLFTLGFVLLGTGLFSAFGNLAAESLAWHADNVALEGRHDDAAKLYLMAASMPGSGLPLKSRALKHASVHDTAHAPRYYAMFAAGSTPDVGSVNDYFARAKLGMSAPLRCTLTTITALIARGPSERRPLHPRFEQDF